jgi:hypothetical protein
MVKPRGTVRQGGFSPGLTQFAEVDLDELHIAAWCHDEQAKEPPEQVHVILKLRGLEDLPFLLRFKSPDTLGFLIEELVRYRREVWPEAEPLDLELNELR